MELLFAYCFSWILSFYTFCSSFSWNLMTASSNIRTNPVPLCIVKINNLFHYLFAQVSNISIRVCVVTPKRSLKLFCVNTHKPVLFFFKLAFLLFVWVQFACAAVHNTLLSSRVHLFYSQHQGCFGKANPAQILSSLIDFYCLWFYFSHFIIQQL